MSEKQKLKKEICKIKRKLSRVTYKKWLSKQSHNYALPTVEVEFSKNFKENVLLDTGSSVNLINENMLQRLKHNKLVKQVYSASESCFSANNESIDITGSCCVKVKLENRGYR